MIRFLRICGLAVLRFLVGLVLLWATGALWFDLPLPELWRQIVAGLFLAGVIGYWKFGRRWNCRVVALAIFVVMAWWFSQRPNDARDWQPDVAQTAWAEVKGDEVTIHNVRNCDYRSGTDFTVRWETRTVRLSHLTGVDLAINYWGSEIMAHPIASFQFSDAPPLCFSIETRREVGEDYSAIGGFYRRYELIYIVADERDVFRLRTNFHTGEDIYLYRMTLTPEQARERFMEYIAALNQIHERPKWYNAVTANCTTSIRNQRDASRRSVWDWRILVNGYADEMLYEQGSLVTGGMPFAELKKHALINETARAANDDPNFSERIRVHLPPAKP